jgi:hypothetical protein
MAWSVMPVESELPSLELQMTWVCAVFAFSIPTLSVLQHGPGFAPKNKDLILFSAQAHSRCSVKMSE